MSNIQLQSVDDMHTVLSLNDVDAKEYPPGYMIRLTGTQYSGVYTVMPRPIGSRAQRREKQFKRKNKFERYSLSNSTRG